MYYALQALGHYKESEAASALKMRDYKDATDLIVERSDEMSEPGGYAVDCRNGVESAEVNGTIQAKDNGGYNANSNTVCRMNHVVRRLTPKECERLQQFPDDWSRYGIDENGREYELSDSSRYKLQGNSIARPFWTWLLRRISGEYVGRPTLGSLFDGQGGFMLCAIDPPIEPIWSSEIEKNAVAVTRKHFGDESVDGDVASYLWR